MKGKTFRETCMDFISILCLNMSQRNYESVMDTHINGELHDEKCVHSRRQHIEFYSCEIRVVTVLVC